MQKLHDVSTNKQSVSIFLSLYLESLLTDSVADDCDLENCLKICFYSDCIGMLELNIASILWHTFLFHLVEIISPGVMDWCMSKKGECLMVGGNQQWYHFKNAVIEHIGCSPSRSSGQEHFKAQQFVLI